MATITRAQFRRSLGTGVEVDDPDLARDLDGSGATLSDLRAADLDGDGVIAGRRRMLDSLLQVVDAFDRDGNRGSFLDVGQAGKLYHALLAARRPPVDGGEIGQAARDRIRSEGVFYAKENSPTSPLAELSGNDKPGETRPAWLKGQNKCNQFVGDVLTQAGVAAPMVMMRDGSLHYGRAETWPSRSDFFDRVTDPNDVKVGDVLVRDYAGPPREGGAHVEVVTSVSPLKTAGAHEHGAVETENDWLDGASYNPRAQSFTDTGGDTVYVLRPTKRSE